MIRLDEVVIVEGKYDKITLENIIDATIVPTNGFGIYKDKSKRDLIKLLSEKHGAIIITDSDNAGQQIRAYIKSFCDTGNIVNVYLPQIKGVESRKTKPSKQGYLGVEGMNCKTILSALERSGIVALTDKPKEKISKTDLYLFGLTGAEGSKSARNSFSEFVSLPVGLSSNAFLDALNAIYDREDFKREATKWRQSQAIN
ncbi:MAG: DUF4093 domain-containing protein [Clostridia bacterium]|nr:DUF4093 domain-containing protein [Clostridia bacterium]